MEDPTAITRIINLLGTVCVSLAMLFVASQWATVHAAPIRYEYGGVITTADPSTGVAPGTRFNGTFTYDPSAPASEPVASTEGMMGYGVFPAPSGINFNIGGQQVFSVGGLSLYLSYGPKYSATPSVQDPSMASISVTAMTDQLLVTLTLTNTNRAVFPPFPIPTSLSLSDLPDTQFLIIDRASQKGEKILGGTVDTLSLVPIPEPSTLTAILVFFSSLVCRQRIKRRW